MNTSNQTYKDLAIPYFAEVFNHIDEVLKALQIPYYLIGVNSIAIQLLQDGIKPSRGTKDIDFAIMIENMGQFDEVVAQLQKRGFHKAKAPWTLYHKGYNAAIDLLPFGVIEENDTVNFNERYTDLHVLGFKEVLEEAVPVPIEEKIANVPPLAGMILLKLIAWNDRPEERTNDAEDIILIIYHYFLLEQEKILDKHFDLLENLENERDRITISARVLGRQAAFILMKNIVLKERVFSILDHLIKTSQHTFFLRWIYNYGWTEEFAISVIASLKDGLMDDLKNI